MMSSLLNAARRSSLSHVPRSFSVTPTHSIPKRRAFHWSVEEDKTAYKIAAASEIINPTQIDEMIQNTKALAKDHALIRDILQKARDHSLLHGRPLGEDEHEFVQGLDLRDAATLLNIDTSDPATDPLLDELYNTAFDIKRLIYGNRIVLFAPLYLSNHCVNSCTYCAFRGPNHHIRRDMLTSDQVVKEVEALQRQGHRRLLVLTGEHPKYTFDMFLDALGVIKNVRTEPCGSIRRLNVEIPALSISDFRRLKATDCVGTYTLFQETYDPRIYQRFHPAGPKSDYEHRLQTMDRAQIAGIDDVGIGALFGLTDYRFEVLALLQHAQHLDRTYHAGPHTISIPRLRPADEAPDAIAPPSPVSDADFKKLVAVLRCAVPYTGMILSTRESAETRAHLLRVGISQMSAGSKADVGSYHKEVMQADGDKTSSASHGQFELQDHRSVDEVVAELMEDGFLPSFCTACYRKSRTGEAFMKIAKTGKIQDFCHPNSLLTLQEYLEDYASERTRQLGEGVIAREATRISESAQRALKRKMEKIKEGARDLYF